MWVIYLAVQPGIDPAVCVSFEGRRAEKRAKKKKKKKKKKKSSQFIKAPFHSHGYG